ncbi:MAG: hypothetical protein KJ077_26060 [Anaerolineae bacterium]|nr:hypothetical protein [Anaerolineae bacterium]
MEIIMGQDAVSRPGPPDEAELLKITREHWAKYRPRAFARLQQSDYLEEAIRNAVTQTMTAMAQMVTQRGLEPWEAWELIREEWILLPAEEESEESK